MLSFVITYTRGPGEHSTGEDEELESSDCEERKSCDRCKQCMPRCPGTPSAHTQGFVVGAYVQTSDVLQ